MPKKGIIAVLSALVLMVIASVSLVLAVEHNASADSEPVLIPTEYLNIRGQVLGSGSDGGAFNRDGQYFIQNYASTYRVEIPNNVTIIASRAFYNCSGLTSITIPASVTSIGTGAFVQCSGLRNVNFTGTIDQWTQINFENASSNPTYNKDGYGATLVIDGAEVTNAVISGDVTAISNYAFYKCPSLTSVTISEGVTRVGDYAFYKCPSLTSITIPASVTNIGTYAFGGCDNLTEIVVKSEDLYNHPALESYQGILQLQIDYTVTFDHNGIPDGIKIDEQVVPASAYATRPDDPTREGYDFMYWYADDENVPFDFTTPIEADITLHAKWQIKTYTVTFAANSDGSGVVVAHDIAYGAYATAPTTTRDGYDFMYWYTDNENVPFDFNQTAITGNTTFYAKWQIKSYTVTFETNSEDTVASQTVEYGSTIELPDEPTKTGHDFVGWYRDAECTEPFNVESPITADTTLYAKWEHKMCTIKFDSRGGTPVNDMIVAYGECIPGMPASTRTGYNFKYWYLFDEDEPYLPNYLYDPVYYGMTLYAKWEAVKYTVTFETNSEDTVASQTVEYGSTIELPDEPTKTGHNFVGWYRNAECTEPFNVESPITADVTLYAKWSINQYHVTFMANGGSTVDTQIVNSNTAATQPDDPTREHYTFDGWYTDTECTQAYNFSNAVTSNLTLYAKWIPEIHTVTFDINGTISSQTVEYGATVTAPTIPTQDGYTFIGWYTEDEQLFNLATPITDDITLHAVWGIRYIVNFVTNGGTIISTQTVSQNGKVEQPVAPMQAGYTFAGWYTDDTFATAYDFDNVVTKNLTLYAKWEPAAVEKESPSNNTGAIVAGAVAGSVAGLGMSGGLVAFLVHRKRRKL